LRLKKQWSTYQSYLMPALSLVAGTLVMVLYTNCTPGHNSLNPLPIVASLNNQDLQQLKASASEDSQNLCDESQIICRRYVFGAELNNSSEIRRHCFKSQALAEEICVQVYEFHYDSSGAMSQQNYEEAYCSDFSVNQAVGKEVRHHSASINEAIEKTMSVCGENL